MPDFRINPEYQPNKNVIRQRVVATVITVITLLLFLTVAGGVLCILLEAKSPLTLETAGTGLGCARFPDNAGVKWGGLAMLTDIGVDVAMALVFIVALGEMCKALSFQLTRLFNFRLMRRRYLMLGCRLPGIPSLLMQTTVALCIESLAKVGAFTLLAFLFLPNWDDTSFSGSNQSPDQARGRNDTPTCQLMVCPGFLDYDICHAMAGCDSSDDAYCCSGTLSCSRKSLFHNWLVGPFVVAPFVDMVPQVLAPLLASVLYRLADYSEGSTNFCAKCCCCACGWLARFLAFIFGQEDGMVRLGTMVFQFHLGQKVFQPGKARICSDGLAVLPEGNSAETQEDASSVDGPSKMPLGQWSGYIWQSEGKPSPQKGEPSGSRCGTPQVPIRACTPSTPGFGRRSPFGAPSRCSTRCTDRASSRLSARPRSTQVRTPCLSDSLGDSSDEEDACLARQTRTIQDWSCGKQDGADKYEAVGYDLPLTFMTQNIDFDMDFQGDSPSYVERKLQDIYTASVQLAEVGVSTIMVENVARRFEGALSSMSKAEQSVSEGSDVEEDPIEDATFQEAMSAYTIHGRMENIVCQMEILLAEVLDTLNEDAMGHGLDVLTGKAIGTELKNQDESKVNITMERVVELLTALSSEANRFDYDSWLVVVRDNNDYMEELVQEFKEQKHEIRKMLMINSIEASEFLNSRLLIAATNFAKWFEKMRKLADEFEDFVAKQRMMRGAPDRMLARDRFLLHSRLRKETSTRMHEIREALKKQATSNHNRRLDAQVELRLSDRQDMERDESAAFEHHKRSRKRKTTGDTSTARRSSLASKRSSHMEEQIFNYIQNARHHLDELSLLVQEMKNEKEGRAKDVLLKLHFKQLAMERKKLRAAAKGSSTFGSSAFESVMPGRSAALYAHKKRHQHEDFNVSSHLLQQVAICRELNALTVNVELNHIWTGVEGQYLMKANNQKPKAKKQAQPPPEEKKKEAVAATPESPGALFKQKGRQTAIAASTILAMQAIQAEHEAELRKQVEDQRVKEKQRALELEQQRAAEEAARQEAEELEEDDDELMNFPPNFSVVDVQLLLSDAAVRRTERLRDLRNVLQGLVSSLQEKFGAESWVYSGPELKAHSNLNPWGFLVPEMEKELQEMKSLGESGRWFLSRNDAGVLQDMLRSMRSVRSQMKIEGGRRKSQAIQSEEAWQFISEDSIKELLERLLEFRKNLQVRKQNAAKLDIRAELTQELAQLHPQLRSGYGLVQKMPFEGRRRQSQDSQASGGPAVPNLKAAVAVAKFKKKLDLSNNIKNLRKEKKDLEASVEDAAEMLQADQALSEKYQEDRRQADTLVQHMRMLLAVRQLRDSARVRVMKLKGEHVHGKIDGNMRSSMAVLLGMDTRSNRGPGPGPGRAARGSSKASKGRFRDAPFTGPAGMEWIHRELAMQEDNDDSGSDSGDEEILRGRRGGGKKAKGKKGASSAGAAAWTPKYLPMEGQSLQSSIIHTARVVAKEVRDAKPGASDEEIAEKPAAPRSSAAQQLNRIFTPKLQKRLKSASDKTAAALVKRSLLEASRTEVITEKLRDSKRDDLNKILRMILEKNGIKTMQRIESRAQQQVRWDGEVDYLHDKLVRVIGVENYWSRRAETWLEQMKIVYGEEVYQAFMEPDRWTQKDTWSNRLFAALLAAAEIQREAEKEKMGLEEAKDHIEAPPELEKDESKVRRKSAYMERLQRPSQIARWKERLEQVRSDDTPQVNPFNVEAVQLPEPVPEPRRVLPVRPPPARPSRAPSPRKPPPTRGIKAAGDVLQLPEDPASFLGPVAPSTNPAEKGIPGWMASSFQRPADSGRQLVLTDELSAVRENSSRASSKESAHRPAQLRQAVLAQARRRSVAPWTEAMDAITNSSFRAAMKSLQKQFFSAKIQEQEAWGILPSLENEAPIQKLHRMMRKRHEDRSAKTLHFRAERNLSKNMKKWITRRSSSAVHSPKALENHRRPHSTPSPPSRTLRRGKAKRIRRHHGLECTLINHGAEMRHGYHSARSIVETSSATSSLDSESESSGRISEVSSEGLDEASEELGLGLHHLRAFRWRLLRRFAGPPEAFAQTVENPLEPMSFDLFCRLCRQIGFDLDLASTVWQLSCSLLGLPDDEDSGMLYKHDFVRAMAFATPIKSLRALRSRLELRYGSVAEAFDEAEIRYLDIISFTDMLNSVGATPAEAKRFFTQFLRHMPKSRAKVSRQIFLTVLRNAEGISAAERLRRGLGLDLKEAEKADEVMAWRCLVELGRRLTKKRTFQVPSKGDDISITAADLQKVLRIFGLSVASCEALLRFCSFGKRPGPSQAIRMEDVALTAVAGIGRGADDLARELGRDYYGEEAMLPEPPEETQERRRRRRYVSLVQAYGYGSVGLARHLRQQMAVSVADAANKIKRGQPHDVAASLSALLAVRPASACPSSADEVPSLRELSLRSDWATPRSVSACSQYDFLT
eukprot:s882_g1.t1